MRRPVLRTIMPPPTRHAGLWLDKFYDDPETEAEDKKRVLVEQVAETEISDAYRAYFARWRNGLDTLAVQTEDACLLTAMAKVRGRMVVGLGTEAVLETSITLHRTYGVPYIPGSALKGLASSYAHLRLEDPGWKKGGEAHRVVFGNTSQAGYITFLDALPLPGDFRLEPDVLTPHHQDYYGGQAKPPADWDSPKPVPFLSATGSYLLALLGPSAWVKSALEILQQALADTNFGIGAKTSSGYGRMELSSVTERKLAAGAALQPTPEEERTLEGLRRRFKAVRPHQMAGSLSPIVRELEASAVRPDFKQVLAQEFCERISREGLVKKLQGKDWYVKLLRLQASHGSEPSATPEEPTAMSPLRQEMQGDGYESDNFMNPLTTKWLPKLGQSEGEERKEIAELLATWYRRHQPANWENPTNEKNRKKVQAIREALGDES